MDGERHSEREAPQSRIRDPIQDIQRPRSSLLSEVHYFSEHVHIYLI